MNKEDYLDLEGTELLNKKLEELKSFVDTRNYIAIKDFKSPYNEDITIKKGDIWGYFYGCDGEHYTIPAYHLYDVQKWLREDCTLYVSVQIVKDNNFMWTITRNSLKIRLCSAKDVNNYPELIYNNSYEEALNEGIKEALKLI